MSISLKIKGNKRTNEGIGNDLVSIGDNRFPVIDAQYPGTKGATDFIVIRHLPDKSIYTIVCKNVTPCDSNREGTLYISVAVPVKEHVEGLFNMLIKLQNAYKSTCMTYDGTMYHFLARNDVAQPFEEIIARHQIDRYPYKTVVTGEDMSAIAYLFMTPEQISDMLNDPMRGEFGRYGQVVLVPVGDPSQYVSTINVPAKIWRSYKIYVNGRQTGQTLADPNKTVTITLPETNSHKSVSTTFSIAQARDTRMPGIAVDDEAQIIYLNMQPEQKATAPKRVEKKTERKYDAGKSKLMYTIIAAGVVIVLGVLAYVLLAPKEENGPKPITTEQLENGKNNDNKDNNAADTGKNNHNEAETSDGKTVDNGETGTIGNDEAEVTDQSEKLLNREDNGTKQGSEEDLKEQFESDKQAIDKAENLTFGNFKNIFKRHKNFNKQNGYAQYKDKVEFIMSVVSFIELLNENIPSNDYKSKIKEFASNAESLGLTGLKAKLLKRIETPGKISESLKVKDRF